MQEVFALAEPLLGLPSIMAISPNKAPFVISASVIYSSPVNFTSSMSPSSITYATLPNSPSLKIKSPGKKVLLFEFFVIFYWSNISFCCPSSFGLTMLSC